MKKEEYIEKCIKNGITGFDYSLLPEEVKRETVKIICLKHGIIYVNPFHFSVGNLGCKKCRINEKMKKKIEEKFANKYDLSEFDYVDEKTDVKVIENEEVMFLKYKEIFEGKSISRKIDKYEFLKRADIKHGDKFNYESIEYIDYEYIIKIKCNLHQIFFQQTPKLHLLSDICCTECKKEYKRNKTFNGKEKFIELANEVFKGKYDYSKVEYVNNKTPVIIIHNGKEYLQRPDSHLEGKSPEKEWKKPLKIEEFLEKAEKKHQDTYSYELVKYDTHKSRIKIICKKHGVFEQQAGCHLHGHGCPTCKESTGEKEIRIFLEANKILFEKEKKFKDCKFKQSLPFDFYLVDYNTCIEYDGYQHSSPINFFGGEKAFIKLKINDNIKNEYCKNNNIKLIRISNIKDIEKEVSKILKLDKMTQEEKNIRFIEKSRKTWGYKYDYSKVNFVDHKTPVIIIYKGVEYKQTPTKHLQKKYCELNQNKLSREEFLRRCQEIWKDRFDYTNTEYINSYSDITFYDKNYGIYITQKAFSHMSGLSYKVPKNNFIELAMMTNDYKYDYEKIEYKNLTDRIKIECNKHGIFQTRGYDHINSRLGGNCQKCDEYIAMKSITKFLNKNNFNFHKEYRHSGLYLPFDFYIPSKRTCIEFDSLQHFQPVDHFGGLKSYEQLKINDKIKNEYCENNYINLIRIKYDQIDRIEEILKNNLLPNSN